MIDKQIIFDRPTRKGTSYFVSELINENDIEKSICQDISKDLNVIEETSRFDDIILNSSLQTPKLDKKDTKKITELENEIITLKSNFIAIKDFLMEEILSINKDEIKFLREDNQSKNEIIKILSENINKLSGDRKVLKNKHEVDCDNSDFRVKKHSKETKYTNSTR